MTNDITEVDDLLVEIMGFTDLLTLNQAKKVSHRWEDLAAVALERKSTIASKRDQEKKTLQLAVKEYERNNDAGEIPIGSYFTYTRSKSGETQEGNDFEMGVLLTYHLPSFPMAA